LDLALLGFFGGFYAVPLNALIQHRPAPEQKGGRHCRGDLLSPSWVYFSRRACFLLLRLRICTWSDFMAGAIMTLGATLLTLFSYCLIRKAGS